MTTGLLDRAGALEMARGLDLCHVCILPSPHEGVRCRCDCGVAQTDYKFPEFPCPVKIANALLDVQERTTRWALELHDEYGGIQYDNTLREAAEAARREGK